MADPDVSQTQAAPMTTPNSDPVCINQVDWLKIFPWLHLIKAARLGVRMRVLVPSLITTAFLAWLTQAPHLMSPHSSRSVFAASTTAGGLEMAPLVVVYLVVMARQAIGTSEIFRYETLQVVLPLLCVIFFGTSIARSAATEFCSFSRTGVLAGARFSARRSFSTLTALLFSILIVGLCFLPLMLSSLLSATVGPTIVLGFWWLIAAFSLVGVLALIVCLCGWLLSFGAVGTDKCGGADALSRCINYTLSHKLFTFWCLWFSSLISFLAMSITREIMALVNLKLNHGINFAATSAAWPSTIIAQTTVHVIALLPAAVHLGTFISGLTITYVLLRQKEDGIDLSEIDGGQHIVSSPPAKQV